MGWLCTERQRGGKLSSVLLHFGNEQKKEEIQRHLALNVGLGLRGWRVPYGPLINRILRSLGLQN
jgi:hypothetical protein